MQEMKSVGKSHCVRYVQGWEKICFMMIGRRGWDENMVHDWRKENAQRGMGDY